MPLNLAAQPSRAITRKMVDLGRRFDRRNWVPGTSGNFSAVLSRRPFVLAVTPTATHKGALTERDVLHVDQSGRPVGRRAGRPSAETALHLAVVAGRSAGAVLHTHSVWATILSESYASQHELILEGYEMLKGLAGVTTHEHRERVPIVDNDQDVVRLAGVVGALLDRDPAMHGFLIRNHGLYTWGATLEDAARHVEIFEFLFEAVGRRRGDDSTG